ncbi:hypothetical protein GH714_030376 [Hevea brasiliensis]|uniref:Uncharacterized protein n=1 Tax=Hevea brasiliensis TaxID=3981 RepID=A0A6A6K8S6_HEVBR|nr:hypothetical protein GH714_030376 [Hevea brasiliensis]
MEASSAEIPFNAIAPPVFNGENYQVWAIRMEAYLDANDLWEAVEEDYQVLPLPDNPTMAQMKSFKERKARKSKAKNCLFAAVSSSIFTKIMSLKTAFDIWNYLKKEYEGNEKIKGMQVLNLVREFEMQKMKESETIKEYSDRLLNIVNKVRLFGTEFADTRIVQKILVTVPERFEATISSLENTKDLSKIGLAELIHALQAQEQRRLMRSEGSVEGALAAKVQTNQGGKGKYKGNKKEGSDSSKSDFPPCKHCNKKGHPPSKCWRRPDVKCEKCQKMGHHQKICKSNIQKVVAQVDLQQKNVVQVADHEEEQLFVATCLAARDQAGTIPSQDSKLLELSESDLVDDEPIRGHDNMMNTTPSITRVRSSQSQSECSAPLTCDHSPPSSTHPSPPASINGYTNNSYFS